MPLLFPCDQARFIHVKAHITLKISTLNIDEQVNCCYYNLPVSVSCDMTIMPSMFTVVSWLPVPLV